MIFKKLVKQISINIIGNYLNYCSKRATSHQQRESCWSIRHWCCWRRVLLLLLFVEQIGVFCWISHLQAVKCCWWKRSINTLSKDSVYIQLILFAVDSAIVQIRRLITACVHILCTYTWEHFVPHLHTIYYHIRETCSIWKAFTDKLSHP